MSSDEDSDAIVIDLGESDNNLERELRRLFHKLIRPFNFKCHTQLLYLLTKAHRNTIKFEEDGKRFSLVLSDNKKSLTFLDEIGGKKVGVCWWGEGDVCENGQSGWNSYLLCARHTKPYIKFLDESRSSLASHDFMKWSPSFHDPTALTSQFSKGAFYETADKRIEEIGTELSLDIANSFMALALIIDPSLKRWDAFVDMNKEWRKRFVDYLKDSCVYFHQIGIAYDYIGDTFLFNHPSITGEKWRGICNYTSKSCFNLEYDGSSKCIFHLTQADDGWKAYVGTKLCALAKVASIKEMTWNHQIEILDQLNLKNVDLVSGHFVLSKVKGKDIILAKNTRKQLAYFVCDNYAAGCAYPSSSSPLFGEPCPNCHYRRVYSAVLLYLPTSKKYISTQLAHLDTRIYKFDMMRKIKNAIFRRDKGESNKEFKLLYRRECPHQEEVNAWCTGLYLYTKVDARLRGTTVEFQQFVVNFSWGAWKAVNWLARNRHFKIVPVEILKGAPSDLYNLYFENGENVIDSQDHQSIVYKIKVDELVYIGEQSVYATKRRPFPNVHENDDPTACNLLVQRLRDKGLDPNTELLDFITIGECTKAETSPFLPETIAMLVFGAKWDILRDYDDKVVNKKMLTASLSATWFEEIQYYLYQLTNGKTIDIVTEEGFQPHDELFGTYEIV